jgi:Uncharacterized protein conserved in bacteria (DUF2059)
MKFVNILVLAGFMAAGSAALANPTPPPSPAPETQGAAVDPANLAIARQIVERLIPPGSLARTMKGVTSMVTDKLFDSIADLSLGDLARLGGMKTDDLAKLGKARLSDIMAIVDPAFKQRAEISTKVMFTTMIGIMSDMEPQMREGMARAYAVRFTNAQLNDINQFFQTPSGAAYASNVTSIATDPEYLKVMGDISSTLMKRFMAQAPEFTKQVEAETAKLPKPRKFEDLTDAEIERLAALMGVPASELRANAGKSNPT